MIDKVRTPVILSVIHNNILTNMTNIAHLAENTQVEKNIQNNSHVYCKTCSSETYHSNIFHMCYCRSKGTVTTTRIKTWDQALWCKFLLMICLHNYLKQNNTLCMMVFHSLKGNVQQLILVWNHIHPTDINRMFHAENTNVLSLHEAQIFIITLFLTEQ
jgi:hypothetical protein